MIKDVSLLENMILLDVKSVVMYYTIHWGVEEDIGGKCAS